jgi:hypothetical protein
MKLNNYRSILELEIVRWTQLKKESGKHKSWPWHLPSESGLHIADTIRRLKALKLVDDLQFSHIKGILGKYTNPLSCDECHKEVSAIVVFEDTEVPNEGGPFGFCDACLDTALKLMRSNQGG